MNEQARTLEAQGKYAEAQAVDEKALEIFRRLLTDNHPITAKIYSNLAANLSAQGKYAEAKGRWESAVKSLEAARLRVNFAALMGAGALRTTHEGLAAVLARLGQPAEAWQALEEGMGRGMLDELAASQDRRLHSAERARLRRLTAELERLDKVVESKPKDLDNAERAKRFEDLKRSRELASVALVQFQTQLLCEYGPLAGQVAKLNEIQAALPADAALVAWVDIPPLGPNAADPDGEHWGVVVRTQGAPTWVLTAGSGREGLWTKEDTALAGQVWTVLRSRPGAGAADVRPLVQKLRAQRLDPLAKALGATGDGLPPARRLIVLPSSTMAGTPIEALLVDNDTWAVSYAPSGTIYKYLSEQRQPDRHSGLWALGDPVYERPDASLPAKRFEVEAIAALFKACDRSTRVLLGPDASERELDRIAAWGELERFGFIHLATRVLIDENVPNHSAVILTQTGLPDPLAQALANKPVYGGRLSTREIRRGWNLRAELVTVSACETTSGREASSEGSMGFAQAFLMAGARSVCLALWKADATATTLLMQRFYANLLGVRPGLAKPQPMAEALAEAKAWLRRLRRDEAATLVASLIGSDARTSGALKRHEPPSALSLPTGPGDERPYAHPHYWAAFILVGDLD